MEYSQRTPRARSAHTIYASSDTASAAGKLGHSNRPAADSKCGTIASSSTRTKPKPVRSERRRPSEEDARGGEGEPVGGDKGISSETLARHSMEQEEDFPILSSITSGGSRQQPLLPTPPRQRVPPQTTPGFAYSSLAERLAADSAAEVALASASAGVQEGKASDSQLRLSVLPAFGGGNPGREHRKVAGVTSTTHGERGRGPGDGATRHGVPIRGRESEEDMVLSNPRPSPPPPPPLPLSIVTLKEHRSGTSAAGALRDRLRARWYRLEAARKAERQREAAERGLMAIEDCEASKDLMGDQRGARWHDRGDGEVDARRGWGQQTIEQDGNGRVGEVDEINSGDSGGEGKSSDDDNYLTQDEENLPVPVATTSACNEEQLSTSGSTTTAATIPPSVVFLHTGQKAISAAGAAAIRRSQQAADDSARSADAAKAITTNPTAGGLASDASPPSATSNEQRGSSRGRRESDPHGYGPQGRELERAAASATVAQESVMAERIRAACRSGQAGLLNELLVRSAGRAADGRDKVRGTGSVLECVRRVS